jgi:hypothetical protein
MVIRSAQDELCFKPNIFHQAASISSHKISKTEKPEGYDSLRLFCLVLPADYSCPLGLRQRLAP